jgi:hypothetical protein
MRGSCVAVDHGPSIGGRFLGGLGEPLLNKPNISYVAEKKRPEIVLDIVPTRHRINIMVFPIFRNWGPKPGHIENGEC